MHLLLAAQEAERGPCSVHRDLSVESFIGRLMKFTQSGQEPDADPEGAAVPVPVPAGPPQCYVCFPDPGPRAPQGWVSSL